jgi:hypothetical protein
MDHNPGTAMPYFDDADELYRYIGALFEDMADDDELVPKLKKANTIAQWRHLDPESQITAKLLEGEDVRVELGPTRLEPEIVMSMDADLAHRFWLGRVNVTVALARGQMKATGPVEKVLKLLPIVKPVFPRYVERLEREGRNDLLADG